MRTTSRTPSLHRRCAHALALVALLALGACGSSDGTDGLDGADGAPGSQTIFLRQIGRYEHTDGSPGAWDESAAEIVAFDPASQRLFVVNGMDSRVDILDASDPTAPSSLGSLDLTNGGAFEDVGGPNSCAVANGIVAVAVENDDKQANGWIQFYTAATGAFLARKEAGALPDMVTFTHDGTKALCANEGEPNGDYSIDPEGSITVVDISAGVAGAVPVQIGFSAFNGQRAALIDAGVRIFGQFGHTVNPVIAFADADPAELIIDDTTGMQPGQWFTLQSTTGDPIPYQIASIGMGNLLVLTDAFDGDTDINGGGQFFVHRHDGASSVAQDVEPEYIAVSEDDSTAYVTLQENNAVAVVDLGSNTVTAIVPLGTKNHMIPGNEIDGSDRDGPGEETGVGIVSRPVHGMFMPDSIAAYTVNGETYLITANEGDAREYDGFVEEVRFKDVGVDPAATDDPAMYDEDFLLGRLATSLVNDTDGDGDLDRLHCYGARSFSVWDASGNLLSDSGSQFAAITANRYGLSFNNDNDETDGDSRSDAKGCEPEACTVGRIGESWYAFIGLERMGGIMVYDVSQPHAPRYVQYVSNRDVTVQAEDFGDPSGDYGPEGFAFVAATDSPTGKPLLIVASEVSGTTTIYEIDQVPGSSKFQADLILR